MSAREPEPGHPSHRQQQPSQPSQPSQPQDDETLAEAFWSVARRLRHLTHDTVTPMGITPAQARALGVLQRHGEMRLSDLAYHLRIAARSATEVADALQERDLASRSPDPQDRRATLMLLTPEGQRLSESLRAARLAETEAFFSRLTTADRQDLARLLRTLREPSED